MAATASTAAGVPAATVMAVYGTVTTFGQGLLGAAQVWSAATGNALSPSFTRTMTMVQGPVFGFGAQMLGVSPARAEQLATYEGLATATSAFAEAGNAGRALDTAATYIDESLNFLGLYDSSSCTQ